MLIATKSLDEGFDLPAIDMAIVFAGSTNHRQLVQRTGRILRRTSTKDSADLYQVYIEGTTEQIAADKRTTFYRTVANSITDEQ